MALKLTHSVRSGPPGHPQPPLRLIWPWQVRGWKRIVKLVIDEVQEDRLTLAAAALAFWAMLALFPMLIALVSMFGLMADPAWIEEGIRQLTGILPPGGRELLREQLHALVRTPSTSLSLGFLISMLAALWSASSGVDTLVDVMNVAYNKIETRNFFKRRLMSLLMTLALIFFTINAILLVAVLPSLTGWLGPRFDILRVIQVVRWPGLAAVVVAGLFCLYRYAPARPRPRRSDVTGPLLATTCFLLFSLLFSLYVSEFASYHKTYGAVGSVVALLFWFYYTSLVILLGAELSAEIEGEKAHMRDGRKLLRESLLSLPRED